MKVVFKGGLRQSVFLSAALILISCVKKTPDQSAEKILARVGDKTISVNEFISRAELTIRPKYCRGNSENHKRIILNSLIAEKLLALEAGKNNELSRDERFQLHLKGRKEQAMRQWLYNHDFYEKVQLDSAEIKKAFELAGRKYDIAYFTMKDSAVAHQIQKKLQQGLSFEEIFRQLEGPEEIPRREVSWDASEHEVIYSALFSEALKINQVIGPIKVENNFYTLIKILGWTDKNVLSDSDVRKRLNIVKKKLKERKHSIQLREYVHRIMRGKKVRFSNEAFRELVKIFLPFYLESGNKGLFTINQNYWSKDSNKTTPNNLEIKMDNLQDFPFIYIDNEMWTIGDFKKELISHPLVLRKNKIEKREFAGQFKLAVVDMIRDKYITKEAYEKGYDKINKVQRYVSMWRDFYYSVYHRYKYLESLNKQEGFNKDYLKTIKHDLNPYIAHLQKKYKDEIEINLNLFKDIRLTNIDLFVKQKNVPFPVVVPAFPLLTTEQAGYF